MLAPDPIAGLRVALYDSAGCRLRLTVARRLASVALHRVCSVHHAGTQDKLRAIAAAPANARLAALRLARLLIPPRRTHPVGPSAP